MIETPYVQVRLTSDHQIAAAEDAVMAALHTTDREIRIVHGLGPAARLPRDPIILDRVLAVYTRPWLADMLWRLEHEATEHVAEALQVAKALRRELGPTRRLLAGGGRRPS